MLYYFLFKKVDETNQIKSNFVIEFRYSMPKNQNENISCTNYPLKRSFHRIKFSNYIKQGTSYFIF